MNPSQLAGLTEGSARTAKAAIRADILSCFAHASTYNKLLEQAIELFGPDIASCFAPLDVERNRSFWNLGPISTRTFAAEVVERLEALSQHLSLLADPKSEPTATCSPTQLERLVEDRLRALMTACPKKEATVQESVQRLLAALSIPHTRERDSVGDGATAYRPDFVVGNRDVAIEVKICNHPERVREITQEIHADIAAARRRYAHMLFIVYDLGHIRDTRQFREPWASRRELSVLVIKH